jgi:hypothetical protein
VGAALCHLRRCRATRGPGATTRACSSIVTPAVRQANKMLLACGGSCSKNLASRPITDQRAVLDLVAVFSLATARKARFQLEATACRNGQAPTLAIGPLRDDSELRRDL